MNNLKEKYEKEVVPELQKLLGRKNKLSLPRLEKVVINMGLGRAIREPKFIDVALSTLTRISGQKPVFTKAKKSISNFKIKKGMTVGAMVTLRGKRMYDFVEKLIRVTFPRVRDFRGIPTKTANEQGNLSIGFKEHLVFPEIKSDEVETIHGLEINIATTAKTKEEGIILLKLLGFPFQEKE